MKIGILTYHRANNVGALLQNYAMQQVLSRMGCDAETIDYKCQLIEKQNRVFSWLGIKAFVKRMLDLKSVVKREIKYNKFRKLYIKMSSKEYDRNSIVLTNDKYDLFISGSDQVWNINLSGEDKTYYLDFVINNKKKCSYACSNGFVEFPIEKKREFLDYIRLFSNVSVREDSLCKYLHEYGIEATVDLDPSLLLTAEDYDVLVEKCPIKIDKPYVFVYMVASTPDILECAKNYADEKGYQVLCMHYNYRDYSSCKNLKDVSPIEFIYLIKNAQKVFCSSFHAVCFSIIYKKDFVCSLEKSSNNNNSRLISLCSILGLESCILDNSENCILNYDSVFERLEHYRNMSLGRLCKIVRENDCGKGESNSTCI